MKNYFASALLTAAAKAADSEQFHHVSHHQHEAVEHKSHHHPLFKWDYERLFDAGEEIYFGTDSESDIDGDSVTKHEHDSGSDSPSSIGLSGPGITYYSGSDSGTESSSHHSQSTVEEAARFYWKNGNLYHVQQSHNPYARQQEDRLLYDNLLTGADPFYDDNRGIAKARRNYG